MKKQQPQIVLPLKGESVAVSMQPKTAALFYDRVWSMALGLANEKSDGPKDIICFAGTDAEMEYISAMIFFCKFFVEKTIELNIRKIIMENIETLNKKTLPLFIKNKIIKSLPRMREKVSKTIRGLSYDSEEAKCFIEEASSDEFTKISEVEPLIKYFNKRLNIYGDILNTPEYVYKDIAKSISIKCNIPVIPIYSSTKIRKSEYKRGKTQLIISSLSNLRIVDENKLTWPQVSEFRKDNEGRKKYKRFLHWLNKDMIGKSQAFIEDEISLKLEEYEQSLKKHGIKTVLGLIEEVFDGKFLTGMATAGIGVSMASNQKLGLLTGLSLVIGKISVKLAKTLLDVDDIKCGTNSEISWVYETKKLTT